MLIFYVILFVIISGFLYFTVCEINRIINDINEPIKIETCEYCKREFIAKGNNKRCPECVRANLGKEIIEEE